MASRGEAPRGHSRDAMIATLLHAWFPRKDLRPRPDSKPHASRRAQLAAFCTGVCVHRNVLCTGGRARRGHLLF